MKHLFILLLLSVFIFQNTIAQKLVKAEEVPELIKKRFQQKYRQAANVKWFQNKNEYTAKFVSNGNPTAATLNAKGKVIETQKTIELKDINNKIATDLRDNHRDLDAQSATLIEKGREKYYSIILHKSQGRKKAPLVYEIQYNFQGKYLTIYEPELEDEPEEELKKDKYAESLEEELDDLTDIEYNVDISKSDLPGAAGTYLRDKFDRDYRYKTVRLNKDKKYGPHYFVEMKKMGEGVTYQFWFDTNGKLLKEKTK